MRSCYVYNIIKANNSSNTTIRSLMDKSLDSPTIIELYPRSHHARSAIDFSRLLAKLWWAKRQGIKTGTCERDDHYNPDNRGNEQACLDVLGSIDRDYSKAWEIFMAEVVMGFEIRCLSFSLLYFGAFPFFDDLQNMNLLFLTLSYIYSQ